MAPSDTSIESDIPPSRQPVTPSMLVRRAAIACIRVYQATAPIRPRICRYHPTCSEYAVRCILKRGLLAGVALGIRRILRCNPFSPGGYDPAP